MDTRGVQEQNSSKVSSILLEQLSFPKEESLKAALFGKVLEFVNDLVLAKRGKHLSEPEIIVLKGAWDNDDYEEIASNSSYSINYLQRRVAPHLWDLLSELLANGQRIGKKKLRHILFEQVTQKYPTFFTSMPRGENTSSNSKGNLLRVFGCQPPNVSNFRGRTQQLLQLKELVKKQRCIALTGVAGIGKSTLAAKLIEEISLDASSKFNYFIWKSASHAQLLPEFVMDLINLIPCLEAESKSNLPESNQAINTVLLKHLQSYPCLIVIDEAESLFQSNNLEQQLDYKLFFRRLIEEQHQSCFLLTSRVWPNDFDALIESDRLINHLRLEGLEPDAAMDFLYSLGLEGEEQHLNHLIQTYRGNPLELKAVVNRIHHFFAGSASKFFDNQTTLLSKRFQEMLNNFFGQSLNKIQREIMIYLAEEIARNTKLIDFNSLLNGLRQKFNNSVSISELVMALEILEKQSLIESTKDPITKEISFTLQPVIKKYIEIDPLGLVQPNTSSQTANTYGGQNAIAS
ncbi:ATP-binding protein [Anabaena minutissima FACHB-250]|nr:ATP-binding protein [Anabaena minutissima FACHB-250]